MTRLSPIAVRLPALWVLAVSTIKMLQGSPNDIPQIVRQNFPGGPEISFFATISIELSFALVTLFHPRLGWILMTALSAVFIAVLVHLIAIGATSCGCFGGAIKLPPVAMLAIDGTLTAFMLATRPWSSLPRTRPRWVVAGLGAALGVVAPWVLIHNETVVIEPPRPIFHGQSEQASGTPNAPTPSSQAPADVQSTSANDSAPTNAASATSAQPWHLPAELPRWVNLYPQKWIGKSIHETELAVWLDTRALPDEGNWILYLDTCEHCRDFLRERASSFATDPKSYVFVKLSTPDDATSKKVEEMPPGELASLPAAVSWVVEPTNPPWELVLEGGVVVSAEYVGE